MITFIEHNIPGYKARTYENAKADITIAIATDFTTPGEKCTLNAVKSHKKTYVQIDLNTIATIAQIRVAISALEGRLIYSLNIAGNGIYSLKHISQYRLNIQVIEFLYKIIHVGELPLPIFITSGGQTGIDEAGLKAAIGLGIPAKCIAPKGWMFRDINGKDIANEQLFKARFDNII